MPTSPHACARNCGRSCQAYEALKQSAGCLDFLDCSCARATWCGTTHPFRAELSHRFTHVLVDEFQDTDPLQAEILLLIAPAIPPSGNGEGPGLPPKAVRGRRTRSSPSTVPPRRQSRSIEDVKQLLLAAGAELLHLSTSFRPERHPARTPGQPMRALHRP